MKADPPIPAEFDSLYRAGDRLRQDLDAHLAAWPVDRDTLSDERKAETEQLVDSSHSWFNLLVLQVLPYTSYERSHTNLLLRRVAAATRCKMFYEEYTGPLGDIAHNVELYVPSANARGEAADAMAEALRLIRTAPPPIASSHHSPYRTTAGHVPNTAFILMWMDKTRPELVDVHETVKSVFTEFGIQAQRADEIQHQDRITDLILEHIGRSEFLFADLSGERPNVYYEVGYAHALGKRPILYRRAGTPLHFDLSVHNVPDYANITELRRMLRERLTAMTGRAPKAEGG